MIIEGGRIASKRHTVFGLIEVDVTEARQILRDYKEQTGESISFTAFIVTCLGKAVEEHKMVHAYRDWRNRLILFDEVDGFEQQIVEVQRVALAQRIEVVAVDLRDLLVARIPRPLTRCFPRAPAIPASA